MLAFCQVLCVKAVWSFLSIVSKLMYNESLHQFEHNSPKYTFLWINISGFPG